MNPQSKWNQVGLAIMGFMEAIIMGFILGNRSPHGSIALTRAKCAACSSFPSSWPGSCLVQTTSEQFTAFHGTHQSVVQARHLSRRSRRRRPSEKYLLLVSMGIFA